MSSYRVSFEMYFYDLIQIDSILRPKGHFVAQPDRTVTKEESMADGTAILKSCSANDVLYPTGVGSKKCCVTMEVKVLDH